MSAHHHTGAQLGIATARCRSMGRQLPFACRLVRFYTHGAARDDKRRESDERHGTHHGIALDGHPPSSSANGVPAWNVQNVTRMKLVASWGDGVTANATWVSV